MLTRDLLLKDTPNLGNGNTLIYGCVVGSHAYGTNVEGSDIDKKWIFVQSYQDFFINGYKPQIEISKDEVAYELSRFLELARKANPTILELLFMPEECIIYKHPVFDIVRTMRRDFLTKMCRYSFGGYAISQIEKAKGLDKKGNWEKERTERKSVLDFCYWISQGLDPSFGDTFYTEPIKKSFKVSQITRMGLSKIPHAHNLYNIFWDGNADFKGVVSNEDTANDVSLSNVPTGATCIGLLHFNKDEYTRHCKDYSEYQEWLEKRNTQRYIDMEKHGQLIDGKNMLHCVRLIETALDIAEHKELIVKRENADFLINIRKGTLNLHNILAYAQEKLEQMDTAFKASNLPDKFTLEGKLKSVHTNVRNVINESQKRTYY